MAGAWVSPARAEGPSFEFGVGSAEIDTASVDYGGLFSSAGQTPLVAQDTSEQGPRYDARIGDIPWAPFGWEGESYIRASYQRAEGAFSAAYPKTFSDAVYVPTGLADTFTTSSLWALAATGSGTIAAAHDLDQREWELAFGVAFNGRVAGFEPRIELGYRRGQIDQTLTADRVGVTPILEEYTTQRLDLSSDCLDLGVGAAQRFPLSQRWSIIADAALGLGYCQHSLDGAFEVNTFGTPAAWSHGDDREKATLRGGLGLGLEWRLAPSFAIALNGFARGESDAPYVAFPAWMFGAFGEVIGVDGEVRVDTESRSSYGAALTLRWTPD